MSDGVSTRAMDDVQVSMDEIRSSLEGVRSNWYPGPNRKAPRKVTSLLNQKKKHSSQAIEKSTEIQQRQGTADTQVTYQSSGWVCINQPQPKSKIKEESQVAASSSDQSPRTTPVISSDRLVSRAASPPFGFIGGLDVQNMLRGKRVSFQAHQKKKMCLWLKENNARGVSKHRDSFQELLKSLGFTDPKYTKEAHYLLHKKTRNRVAKYGLEMKNSGATIVANKGLENETIHFAPWTDLWLSRDWDGSIETPSHLIKPTVEPDPIHAEENGERCSSPSGPEILVVDVQLQRGEQELLRHVEEDEDGFWSDKGDDHEPTGMEGIAYSTIYSGTTNTTPNLPYQHQFGTMPEEPFVTNTSIMKCAPQMELGQQPFLSENQESEIDGYYPGGILAVSRDELYAFVDELQKNSAEMRIEAVDHDESGNDGDGELSDFEDSETAVTTLRGVSQLATMAPLPHPRPEPSCAQEGDFIKSPHPLWQHCGQSFTVIEIESPEDLEKWRMQLRAISLTQNIWGILTGVHVEPILKMSPRRKTPKINLLPSSSVYGSMSLPMASASSSYGLGIEVEDDDMEVEEMEYNEEPAEYKRKLAEWNAAREKVLGWMLMTIGEKTRAGVRAYEKQIGKVIHDPRVLMSLLESRVKNYFEGRKATVSDPDTV